jgi:hypothetical protein
MVYQKEIAASVRFNLFNLTLLAKFSLDKEIISFKLQKRIGGKTCKGEKDEWSK